MATYKNFKTYKRLTTPKLKLPTPHQATFATFIQIIKTLEGEDFRQKRDQWLRENPLSFFNLKENEKSQVEDYDIIAGLAKARAAADQEA